jgi:hypothetical protein
MKLSDQAIGALLMTLQKCLAEQIDITDLLKDWDINISGNEIVVTNPPTVTPTDQPEKQMFETE